MKKQKFFIMMFFILLLLAGCSGKTAKNTIRPKELQQETSDILKMIEGETTFFEFDADNSFQSFSVDIWENENGNWENAGKVYGKLTQEKEIGIQIIENQINIFLLSDTGYTKSSYTLKTVFEKEMLTGKAFFSSGEKEIKEKEEIALWVKTATEKNQLNTILENFRENDAEKGVAITISFYKQSADETE